MDPETIEDVLALIEKRPADAGLYQRLGQLCSKANRADEARRAFERSLELDPKDAFTHLFLGNSFYACQMYPEALARFQHAGGWLGLAKHDPADVTIDSAVRPPYPRIGIKRKQVMTMECRVQPSGSR
jgi:tetratricopeptide (TPR) repeat protein